MGSVKPSYIKNFAKELMRTYEGSFSLDFNENKARVGEFTNIKNKTIRNRIAGYITRILEQRVSRRREVESDV
ncbi:MAG: 30S ribosomal protein S17e [Methanosaeta sp. PtaB.Bin039]|nr:MAG: 30S ribosomal protein S17e [Methanosaeta sp. PtaB.Bin039]OPY47397.1 MAG: 30S ribosomal protein S17e [Methanosaeta sp. PtaU1.Bin028]HOT07126.1 30S ribosomal protein S17e [Methanotrichaceae archaeon]HQF17070.1 30S ribosomal protein S17e [Methanotrichaceae archaeon]HQI91691.1 30S ribosomal protein S17e [Methanotrichaceae archaeon]